MEKLDLSERHDLIQENRHKIESLKREIHRAQTLSIKKEKEPIILKTTTETAPPSGANIS